MNLIYDVFNIKFPLYIYIAHCYTSLYSNLYKRETPTKYNCLVYKNYY